MRGERIMLDYTQNAVGVRFEVDGVWMNVDPYDRQTGDAMLAVLKKIANLNVQDRRTRQEGKFGAVFHAGQYICTLTSQGVKTGERVLIKLAPKKSKFETLEDLGMRPKMREQFKELVDQHRKDLSSSPPRPAADSPRSGGVGLITVRPLRARLRRDRGPAQP